MMTGIFIGAKNNSSIKPSIKSDCSPKKESIISEISIKSAEKIYSAKMSNGIKKQSKNKVNTNKLPDMTSSLSPIIYPASIPSSHNNSKGAKIKKVSGS